MSLADQIPDSDAPFVAMPALSTRMTIVRNISNVNSYFFLAYVRQSKIMLSSDNHGQKLGLRALK